MGDVWWSLAKNGSEIKSVRILKQKSCRRISRMLSCQLGENNPKITEYVLFGLIYLAKLHHCIITELMKLTQALPSCCAFPINS